MGVLGVCGVMGFKIQKQQEIWQVKTLRRGDSGVVEVCAVMG